MVGPWKRFVPFVLVGALSVGAALLTASPTGYDAQLKALGSKNYRERATAIKALGSGGAEKCEILLAELANGDHSPLVRAGLVSSIRAIGVTSSQGTKIGDLLESQDPGLRQSALLIAQDSPTVALGSIQDRLLDAEERDIVRATAAIALAKGGSQCRPVLLRMLRDKGTPELVRAQVIKALPQTGTLGIEDIDALAKNAKASKIDRQRAIRALPQKEARSHLDLLTRSATAWVRAEATAVLGQSAAANENTMLVRMATDTAPSVRLAALRGLMDNKGTVAHRATIVALLSDTDPRVQALAAHDIGRNKLNDYATVKAPLQAMVASKNFKARYEASLALAAYGDKYGATRMGQDRTSKTRSEAIAAGRAYAAINAVK